jgi:isopentenyl-diphosphate delta-isomerase
MDELIDVLDAEGNATGKTCLKSIVHKTGLYHATVHIWFYTTKGSILLQQRASSKIIYPLLWDVSVAGHIDAGEGFTTAAVREIKEEIGLIVDENDLVKIGVFKSFQKYDTGIIDNEFHHVFIAELKVDLDKLICQKEEVEALKLVTTKTYYDLLNDAKTSNHFIASNKKYYKFVLKSIQNKINTKHHSL